MKTLDHIALIVTITISAILLIIIIGPMVTGRVLSDGKAQIVGNLISSFIAIIGMYVGAKLKDRDDHEKAPKEKEPKEVDGLGK